MLITERAEAGGRAGPGPDKVLRDAREIEEIKNSGLSDRVAQLCTELAALQKEDDKEYARLRRGFSTALEDEPGGGSLTVRAARTSMTAAQPRPRTRCTTSSAVGAAPSPADGWSGKSKTPRMSCIG